MTAVFKREFKAFFTNMVGYIFIAFMLLITGIYATAYNFSGGYPNFEFALNNVSFIFAFVVPLLTMRAMAEDKRQNTDQLLFTSPVSVSKIIMGKYFAMLTILLITVAVICVYPLILSMYGSVNFSSAYGAIVGFFFLGAALIAIGMFLSSLTESQLIAAVVTIGVFLALYLMSYLATLISPTAFASMIAFTAVIIIIAAVLYLLTKNIIPSVVVFVAAEVVLLVFYFMKPGMLEGRFRGFLETLAVFDRYGVFVSNGIFDLTTIVYYLSIVVLFLFFCVQAIEKRRWS